jgi:transposase
MRSLEDFPHVYLHRDPVDMRKSINGLSSIVMEEMGLDFERDRLFVFIGRCGRKLKLVYWDLSGFALWYKRLEKERFRWPKALENATVMASSDQLRGLLAGFDMFQKPHDYLRFEKIG